MKLTDGFAWQKSGRTEELERCERDGMVFFCNVSWMTRACGSPLLANPEAVDEEHLRLTYGLQTTKN